MLNKCEYNVSFTSSSYDILIVLWSPDIFLLFVQNLTPKLVPLPKYHLDVDLFLKGSGSFTTKMIDVTAEGFSSIVPVENEDGKQV